MTIDNCLESESLKSFCSSLWTDWRMMGTVVKFLMLHLDILENLLLHRDMLVNVEEALSWELDEDLGIRQSSGRSFNLIVGRSFNLKCWRSFNWRVERLLKVGWVQACEDWRIVLVRTESFRLILDKTIAHTKIQQSWKAAIALLWHRQNKLLKILCYINLFLLLPLG